MDIQSHISYAYVLGDILKKDYGFEDVGSQCSRKDASSVTACIKELRVAKSHSKRVVKEWSKTSDDNEFPPFENAFGVFVRNGCGQVLGGVYGHILQNAITPHAYIDVFYMDELVRGTGLGRHVMSSVEMFLKKQNISIIEIGTGDHQAPWFYEKIGYKKIITYPRLLQNKDGQYLKCYNCEKRI